MGLLLSYTDHKCPKPYWNIGSLPDYILSLIIGNRLTDTTYLSPQYNLHTSLCPARGRTFLATSRLIWPSYKPVCTARDKLLGALL